MYLSDRHAKPVGVVKYSSVAKSSATVVSSELDICRSHSLLKKDVGSCRIQLPIWPVIYVVHCVHYAPLLSMAPSNVTFYFLTSFPCKVCYNLVFPIVYIGRYIPYSLKIILSVRPVISPYGKMSRSGPFITKDLTIVNTQFYGMSIIKLNETE